MILLWSVLVLSYARYCRTGFCKCSYLEVRTEICRMSFISRLYRSNTSVCECGNGNMGPTKAGNALTGWITAKPWMDIRVFRRVRKAFISFVMSVCPSVRMEQLGSHWKESYEIWHSIIFRKSFEKIDVWWKYDTTKGYFTLKLCTVMIILLRMRNISKKL